MFTVPASLYSYAASTAINSKAEMHHELENDDVPTAEYQNLSYAERLIIDAVKGPRSNASSITVATEVDAESKNGGEKDEQVDEDTDEQISELVLVEEENKNDGETTPKEATNVQGKRPQAPSKELIKQWISQLRHIKMTYAKFNYVLDSMNWLITEIQRRPDTTVDNLTAQEAAVQNGVRFCDFAKIPSNHPSVTNSNGKANKANTLTFQTNKDYLSYVSRLITHQNPPVTVFQTREKVIQFKYVRHLWKKGEFALPNISFTCEDVDRLYTCGYLSLAEFDFPLGCTMLAHGVLRRHQRCKGQPTVLGETLPPPAFWTISADSRLPDTFEVVSGICAIEKWRSETPYAEGYSDSPYTRPQLRARHVERRIKECGLFGLKACAGIDDEGVLKLLEEKDPMYIPPKEFDPKKFYRVPIKVPFTKETLNPPSDRAEAIVRIVRPEDIGDDYIHIDVHGSQRRTDQFGVERQLISIDSQRTDPQEVQIENEGTPERIRSQDRPNSPHNLEENGEAQDQDQNQDIIERKEKEKGKEVQIHEENSSISAAPETVYCARKAKRRLENESIERTDNSRPVKKRKTSGSRSSNRKR